MAFRQWGHHDLVKTIFHRAFVRDNVTNPRWNNKRWVYWSLLVKELTYPAPLSGPAENGLKWSCGIASIRQRTGYHGGFSIQSNRRVMFFKEPHECWEGRIRCIETAKVLTKTDWWRRGRATNEHGFFKKYTKVWSTKARIKSVRAANKAS